MINPQNPANTPPGAPTEHIAAMPEHMIRGLSQRYATNDMDEISRMLASEQLMHHYGPNVQYLTTARAAIRDPKAPKSSSGYGSLTVADKAKMVEDIYDFSSAENDTIYGATNVALNDIKTVAGGSRADPELAKMSEYLTAKRSYEKEQAIQNDPSFLAYDDVMGSPEIKDKYRIMLEKKRRSFENVKHYETEPWFVRMSTDSLDPLWGSAVGTTGWGAIEPLFPTPPTP